MKHIASAFGITIYFIIALPAIVVFGLMYALGYINAEGR